MKKLFSKPILFISIIILILLLIGFADISYFDYYEVPDVDTDFLSDTNQYSFYNNQVVYDNDCDCVVSIDIYKGVTDENIENDFYIAVISIDIDMDDDLSTQTLSEFDSIESVSIKYDMSSETDYNLANYTGTNWGEHKHDLNISFSWDKFIGKKSIQGSLNLVGYTHFGTSTANKVYNGHFDYKDYTADCHQETMIIIEVPKDSNFSFAFDYKIEIKHTELYFASFEHSEITGNWKTVTVSNN
jgi:hypothetical protein